MPSTRALFALAFMPDWPWLIILAMYFDTVKPGRGQALTLRDGR